MSWEACYRVHHLGAKLDLRTVPSIIGGSTAKRNGIVLAKSIPAKKYNIKTGEPITDAHRKCPTLINVPPHYELYEDCSTAFKEILTEYTDCIEEYSVDEVFMDLSSTMHLFGDNPVELANSIKDRIRDELGFTVNVGVSSVKVLAKMASDFQKPDRVHTLFPSEIQKKMWPLDVGELFFVGQATRRKLYNLGIFTIGELANTDPAILRSHLKKHGIVIWQFANGYDFTAVENEEPPNKGYGNSKTIPYDVRDAEGAKRILLSLTEKVVSRLMRDDAKARCVSISIKYGDFEYVSHQRVLSNATDLVTEIHGAACQLFDEVWSGYPIRHLGVRTTDISYGEVYRQSSLFDSSYDEYMRQKRLQRAVQDIRQKYGSRIISRGSAMASGVGDMAGGISKEKAVTHYSKVYKP